MRDTAPPIAVITPSYGPDFTLCCTLNRSVLQFLPANVRHYIVVDRRDLRLFRRLKSERTIVIAKEEVLPRGVVQLPLLNRWIAPRAGLPISGWLVQQIAKIAVVDALQEPVLVLIDSDATFVREVPAGLFVREGKTRLYRGTGVITSDMPAHVAWHENACELLGVDREQPPMNDYIGQVISWDRALVKAMCRRIEDVTGMAWWTALARARRVSEYLLYGVFVERVPGAGSRVWVDERPRCTTHWDIDALPEGRLREFAGSIRDGDVALMIASHSKTSAAARRAVIALATNGRLESDTAPHHDMRRSA